MVRQRYGQHFLVNSAIAEREVSYASLRKDDVVLEIGPGKGIITNLLSRHAKQVIAIEIDQTLVDHLTRNLPSNVTLIRQDALAVDFTSLPRFTKIVSNLPFEISSPITFKFLDSTFIKAILMYQKDFALRLVASPGSKEYSRLTVAVYYKAYCRILEDVSRNNFDPAPKVDSCIVELILREKPAFQVKNERFFFDFIKLLFTHRRKKIRTTVKTMTQDYETLPYLEHRVEELTPEQIGALSDTLWQLRNP
jgi:16S rRNA (adenine1518-N6/adenine1519-N6)-dimethyltransferase